jgi:tetratricopeptide (TPR) repeat protein
VTLPPRAHRYLSLAAALGVVSLSCPARAQPEEPPPDAAATPEEAPIDEAAAPAPDGEHERARALFEQGEAAYSEGRYLEAARRFQEAAIHEPNPALSYNIALAYDAVSEDAEALRWYRDYLRNLPQATDRDEVLASIRRLETRLQKLGVQQVTVLSTPSGATVHVDGQITGVTPWTGQMIPGVHRAEITRDGYLPAVVEFTLAEDRAVDVGLILSARPPTRAEPAPPPPVAPPAPVLEPSRIHIRARTWALCGGGLGLLGTSLGFEAARARSEQDARSAELQVDAAESVEAMHDRQTVARVLALVGSAVTAAGGVSLVIDLGATRSSRADVTPDVACASDGCWLGARGRF